ncbi:MAG TPA: carboxymuconolactone decarboxylase family protein [Kofleriaceae bacterium]|nr:carboxymuconolactone decarboxylase family protein [Kofleriaceae bacterium]
MTVAEAQRANPPAPMPSKTAQPAKQVPIPTAAEVLDEVNAMFGFVPAFIKAMPDHLLPGFWVSMKGFQMNPNTALDAKTKELIGIAVAAQIPCEYCTYFHTIAAKNNGATDQEIREAVGMAGMTRMGSTLLNGLQLDRAQFRKDVDRMMKVETKGKTQASRVP